MPPSSSGPGRGPLKAKTGVRVPLGAPSKTQLELRDTSEEEFLETVHFEQPDKLAELSTELVRDSLS